MNLPLRSYVTAGRATFTLVSARTGNRLTYRVRKPKKDDSPAFVSVMQGNRYQYLGYIFPNGNYVHGRKSDVDPATTPAKVFPWFWGKLANLPAALAFLPSTKCCCCGRELTTPESIAAGIGPECAKMRRPWLAHA